jgi:cyclopropane fatty-acyl-phospholipid synthase-like methyltransferase
MPLLRESFRYPHGDPSVLLFAHAVEHWPLSLPHGATVLELGCCETDFCSWLLRARPDVRLIGVDVNDCPSYSGEFVKGDAAAMTWPAGTFDAVIALGSLEHFGLGYYGDPLDHAGDSVALANAAHGVVPGGWL